MTQVIEFEQQSAVADQATSRVLAKGDATKSKAASKANELIEALRHNTRGVSEEKAAALFERQRAVERLTAQTIMHPAHERCIATIASMHALRRVNGRTPRGMLITGLSGCGKSTLAKSYAELYPSREEDDRTVIPVLYVELPGQPTAKAFAESMLNSMGAGYVERGSAEAKLDRIRKLLVECRVELVILDEMQHVVDNLDNRSRDITADTFKNLMNKSCVPHVFVGGPSCRGYFVQNQQLGRRCTPKVHLRPFGIASARDSVDFQRLLKALALRLPFAKPSALLETAMVEPLWFASFGLIGQLTQLVKAALEFALDSGADTLTRGHLSRAFAETIYTGCPKRRNPFEAGFKHQALVNEGEPFHGFVG